MRLLRKGSYAGRQRAGLAGATVKADSSVPTSAATNRQPQYSPAFAAVASQLPAPAWLADASGNNLFCNTAYLSLVGASADTQAGEGWLRAVHDDDRAAFLAALEGASATGHPIEHEVRVHAAGGGVLWLRCQITRWPEAGGSLGICTDITDLKASAGESAFAVQRFTTLSDALPGIVWMANAAGDISFVNDQWREFSGLSDEQWRTAHWTDFVHPDDVRSAEDEWQRCVRTGDPYSVDYRLRRADGSYRWHTVRGRALLDSAGNVLEWAGTCVDIHMVRMAQIRSRMLADALPQIVSAAAADGTGAYFNRRWYDYTGLSEAQSIGSGWLEAVHPADAAAVAESWSAAVARNAPFEAELRLRRSDGQYRWHITRSEPIREPGGDSIIAWFATSTDIDDLRYEQARYRSLSESLTELVWTSGSDGEPAYLNARARRYFGKTPVELAADRGEGAFHPEDREHALSLYRQALRSGEPFEMEYRLRRHDGAHRWHIIRGVPLRDHAGNVIGWAGSATDIHDLRSEQLRTQVLTDAIPALVFTADARGRVDYANQQATEYLGRTLADLRAHGWGASIHAEDRRTAGRAYSGALRAGRPYEAEVRLLGNDGRFRWHMVRAVPLRDANGSVTAWFGTATDIAGQKHAEQQIASLNRELELRLADHETLLEVLPVGVGITHDNEAHSVIANAEMVRMLNARVTGDDPGHRVLDQSSYTLTREGVPFDKTSDPMLRAIREGNTVSDRLEMAAQDGASRHFLAFATPLRDGQKVRGAVSALVDVSDMKRVQDELEAARGRYAAAGEAVPFGIWSSDANGRYTDVSDSYLEMLGCTLEELTAEKWIENLAPDRREAALSDWHACVRTRADWNYEHEFLGADGAWHVVLSRGRPVYDSERRFCGYAGINLDITDLKRMQRELASTVEELRQASQVKDELLGLVSHELRTPLTTIFGNAQALRRHGDKIDGDTRSMALQDIEDDAVRLQRLIENMLVLARLEGSADLSPEPVLLQRLLPRLAIDLQRKGLRIGLNLGIPDTLPPASAQPGYIEQTVANLVSNAVKYSTPGATVELRAQSNDGYVAIFVEDRGSGITPEEADRVFAPFFRSQRTADQASGIGLGLAVCKRLVEAQGGRIWAAPRDGGGTTIAFTLPIARD